MGTRYREVYDFILSNARARAKVTRTHARLDNTHHTVSCYAVCSQL